MWEAIIGLKTTLDMVYFLIIEQTGSETTTQILMFSHLYSATGAQLA